MNHMLLVNYQQKVMGFLIETLFLRIFSCSRYLAKYHEGGRPTLPTTDADGSVVDVEMPAKGYAAGPIKQIESMERKAKKIMTEPQNSDPQGAKNAFHRNHSSVGETRWIRLQCQFILKTYYHNCVLSGNFKVQ